MEAAATGGPNSAYSVSTGAPSASLITLRASSVPKGAIRSWRFSRSRASAAPTMSGRVARNWPNLTQEGPSRVSAADSRTSAPPALRRSISRPSATTNRSTGGSDWGSMMAKTPSRAQMKPARARRTKWPMARNTRSGLSEQIYRQIFQAECSATTPPVMGVADTRSKPAAAIMSENTARLGKRRIDSTRYS